MFSAGYAATVAYAPALMFVVIAVCCVVASLIVLYVRVRFGVLGDEGEEEGESARAGHGEGQGAGKGQGQGGYQALANKQ